MSRERTQREEIEDVIGRWAWLLIVIGLVTCIAGAIFFAGCTVRPKIVRNQEASFDGNEQNSGLIGHDGAGNGIITAHARDRYNALMDDYGKLFEPPVNRDDGITPRLSQSGQANTFLIDKQHLFIFATANRWRHQKLTPDVAK